MAEKLNNLVLLFNCTDGMLFGNRRFLEVHSKTIKSSEEFTSQKATSIDLPFRKVEIQAIFDIIDNRNEDIKRCQTCINYQEFLKAVHWFNLEHFGIYCIDNMFFYDGLHQEQSFFTKCKKCYEEINHEQFDGAKFYDMLPEIFKSLGYN